MASIREEIFTAAPGYEVWDAIRDVGALHTRLVPGFVVDTRLEQGVRVVTFGNGMTVHEPIVDVDDRERRLVWSAAGATTTHYNASLQVFDEANGSRVVWIVDLLPHEAAGRVGAMMKQGIEVMKRTLDGIAA